MPDRDPAPDAARFPSTCWSLVLAAKGREEPRASEALAALCAAYWYPTYAFVRRKGHGPDHAADLTQGFFARLLEKGDLGSADRARGRFRSFLMAACSHYLCNERDRARTQAQGGGRPHVSIDARDAEGRYLAEPAHGLTAERLFQRRWALTLLDGVLARLAQESLREGKGELFDRLEATLAGGQGAMPYARIGRELGMSEGAVKVAAHRLRRRFRDLLRQEVGRTVDDPAGVDDEIRDLFAALAGRERGKLL